MDLNDDALRIPRKLQFSISRLLVSVAIFAVAIVLFQRASALNAHAFASMRGPVVISVPALINQWVASSLMFGGIAVLPYGQKGFILGTIAAAICVPLLLIAFLFVRAGGNI